MYVVGSKSYRPDIQKPRQMQWWLYTAIYGEVNVSVEKVCWNKGRLCWKIVKLFYFCHLKKLVRPETFRSYHVCTYVCMYVCMCVYVYMYVCMYVWPQELNTQAPHYHQLLRCLLTTSHTDRSLRSTATINVKDIWWHTCPFWNSEFLDFLSDCQLVKNNVHTSKLIFVRITPNFMPH